jgi:hypothetical protein
MNVSARFWSKVDRSESCWVWTASRNAKGYGIFAQKHAHRQMSHRTAWELTYGVIPQGLRVLHRCDNPPCVRPEHLFLGTIADNQADMVAKGRSVRGLRQRNVRLTPELVTEIRLRYGAAPNSRGRPYGHRAISYELLGREYGVSKWAIRAIVTGRTWAWLEQS